MMKGLRAVAYEELIKQLRLYFWRTGDTSMCLGEVGRSLLQIAEGLYSCERRFNWLF